MELSMKLACIRATVLVAAVSLAAPLSAQRLAGANPTGNVPAPVALDTTGMFQARFAKVGDDMFIGGQPTAKALRNLRAQGVTAVVNLRTPPEMDPTRIGFDEAALAKEL